MPINSYPISQPIITACQAMNNGGFVGFYHSLVKQFISNVPMEYNAFRSRTSRCTRPLINDAEALFYSVAYEMGHYTVFREVLSDNLIIDSEDVVINIVDYGCGQGVATLATLAYIASQQNASNIRLNIHLIEPSITALSIACYKVSVFAQALGFDVVITYHNCSLDKVRLPNINNIGDTFHLMSYILDVQAVQSQLDGICQQIRHLPNNNVVIASGIGSSDIRSNGYLGFNLLAHLLTGKTQAITKYPVGYCTYRPKQKRYEQYFATAIGMGIALNGHTMDKVA